ncbi:MAG: helix-turn-helix domain-containing protein [Desulfurococcaceae archaeon]
MNQEIDLVEEVLGIVKKANFRADLILYPKESRSVDIVARSPSGNNVIVLKIVEDAKNLTRQEISDLRKIKLAYQTPTIIVAREHHGDLLDDDVVYYKHDNVVITPKTLETYLVKNEKPIVACIRGNYVLRINPNKLKERKEELKCSRGILADILGISKKAVYMYERGEMYISLDKGIRLASVLGEDVFEEIDILKEGSIENKNEEESLPRDQIEDALYKMAVNLKQLFINFLRLPIDVAIKGKLVVTIVKKSTNGNEKEKLEYAEKLAESVNTKIFIVGSLRDISEIRKHISLIRVNEGEIYDHPR